MNDQLFLLYYFVPFDSSKYKPKAITEESQKKKNKKTVLSF